MRISFALFVTVKLKYCYNLLIFDFRDEFVLKSSLSFDQKRVFY